MDCRCFFCGVVLQTAYLFVFKFSHDTHLFGVCYFQFHQANNFCTLYACAPKQVQHMCVYSCSAHVLIAGLVYSQYIRVNFTPRRKCKLTETLWVAQHLVLQERHSFEQITRLHQCQQTIFFFVFFPSCSLWVF